MVKNESDFQSRHPGVVLGSPHLHTWQPTDTGVRFTKTMKGGRCIMTTMCSGRNVGRKLLTQLSKGDRGRGGVDREDAKEDHSWGTVIWEKQEPMCYQASIQSIISVDFICTFYPKTLDFLNDDNLDASQEIWNAWMTYFSTQRSEAGLTVVIRKHFFSHLLWW